jgi:hypothetical protein
MLKLQYSPINQAWIFSWENIVLHIFNTKEEAAWHLKTETTLASERIAELLDGKLLRHMAA